MSCSMLHGLGDCTPENHCDCLAPTITDNARAEAERRWPRLYGPEETLTYPREAVREHTRAGFMAGAEWAAGRAASVATEAVERIARQIARETAMTGRDALELVEAVQALQDAETTTATTDEAVGELLKRMSDAVTQLEALRAEHWEASERQRLHGKIEGIKLAASYVEEIHAAMERRRRLSEMTRQAFEDGLYETTAEDYTEALRRARAVLHLRGGA